MTEKNAKWLEKQERFLSKEQVTILVRRVHWLAVLSWIIPADCVIRVMTDSNPEFYKVSLILGDSAQMRWGLPLE